MILAEEASQVYQLVREGGPFVVAFAVLVLGGGVFWKMVGKPTLDALMTISANFAKAADKLENGTHRQEAATARHEALADRLEERLGG